jgi:trk system potassium uptake protein TrkH
LKRLVKIIDALRLILSLCGIALVVFDDGWQGDTALVRNVWMYYGLLFLGISATILASLFFRFRCKQRLRKGDFTMALLSLLIGVSSIIEGQNSVFLSGVSTFFSLIYFLVEISRISLSIQRRTFRPAKLFVLSFMFLIVAGTLLLMLPGATINGISFVDALFTATSAVTVTGLAVLDTGKIFTIVWAVCDSFPGSGGWFGDHDVHQFFGLFL